MRLIRTFVLAVLVTAVGVALLGASPASAESTALCKVNEYPCPESSRISTVNLELASGSTWSLHTTKPSLTVLCLATQLKVKALAVGSPQVIDRTTETHTKCGTNAAHNNCTVTTFIEGTSFHLLKTAANLGELEATQGETEVKCTSIPKLECTYHDAKVIYHVEGKNGKNGHGIVSAAELPVEVAGGASCPEKTVLTTSLEFSEDAYLGGKEPSLEEEFGTENPAIPDLCEVCVGDPINSATGNLTEIQTDLTVSGHGPHLELTRSYNAQLAATQKEAGPFGYGWTGSYSASLAISSETETATVHQDNGSTATFYLKGGKYSPSGWVEATLVKEGENYVYTLSDQEQLEFNSSGQLVKVSDRHKNALTLTYKSGQLETVKDAAGRTLTFTYNAGKVESVKDPLGNVAKYTYESGNLATVALPGEETSRWKFKYDASHRLTEVTDGRSHTTKNEYDSSNRVTLQTDRLGQKRKLEYAETGGVKETTITEPNSSKTLEKFNGSGEPLEITKASGTELAQTTKYEYDSNLKMTKRTDANGHVKTYGYDSEGNKTSEKDANENETKWVYNKTHDVIEETTPKGETTTTTRNAAGDPETIKRPAPESKTQEIKFKYAANGDLEENTDPLGRTTKYEYDTYGDRKAEINAENDKRTWGYNEDGQLTSEVSPRGNEEGAKASEFETKIERDAQGRATKETNPLGHETKFKYDGNGNLEVVTNPNGHATTYAYDANDQRTEVKAPNGNTVKTAYDSMGKVESHTNGSGNVTKYVHNTLEQLTETIDPLERKVIEKYDAVGNVKEIKDAEGRTATYTYDPGDRLKEVNYSAEATPDVSYTYDKDGTVLTMKDGTGTNKYTYDELDRLTEMENGGKGIVKYKYDLGSQMIEITYPNGKSITRVFDKAGRLEKITDWLGKESKFAYSRDSLLKSTTFPTASEDKDEYAYNVADRLEKTTMKRGAETLASISYARDNAGQIKSTTQTGLPGAEKVEYEYDENERLKKGAGTSFGYDAANNPTTFGSASLKYDKASQLEEGGGIKYSFNSMGQRTKATPSSGPATTYGYDQAGNLTSVKRPEEGKVNKIEDSYTYDGGGLRASETVNGTTTQMTWDLAEPLPLLLYDGTNSYIYGPEGIPVEQIASETATYLHHDQQGSTRLLTNAAGETKGTYTFTPYGAVEGQTGTATTPLGFNAQYTSSDTGLIYLRARVYDPLTAQFTSVDPLVEETLDFYGYAGDNPVNAADPSGKQVVAGPPRPPIPNPPGNFNWADGGYVENVYGYAFWSASAWRDGASSGWTFSALGYDVYWGDFTWSISVTRDGPETTWSFGIIGSRHSYLRSGFGCPLFP